MTKNRPKVGIGVIILGPHSLSGVVLLGLRCNKEKLGCGEWGVPGGHLEFGEEFFDCAKRETEEETGLVDLLNLQLVEVKNSIFEKAHYVTIYMACISSTSIFIPDREPHNFSKWEWFDVSNLPEKMFEDSRATILDLVNSKKG